MEVFAMNIKNISCDQFAGLLDMDWSLEPGLNMVIGANEAGKSTLIDLIYYMFFQNVKINNKTDAAFVKNYFPNKVTGIAGDVIDGKLKLETEEGTYVITKEWGKDKNSSNCSMRLPDGTKIKSEEEINKVLKGFFDYDEGLLSEIVFPSKKRDIKAVESILKKLSGKKEDDLDALKGELSSALTQAALETGGVSIDKLESELKNKLNMYGERWDFERAMPENGPKRGIDNPWPCADTKLARVGQQAIVLRNYYELKAIEREQMEVQLAEKQVDNYKSKLMTAQSLKKQAHDKREDFNKYAAKLDQSVLLKEHISRISAHLKELKEDSVSWPDSVAGLKLREELKVKLEQAKLNEHYHKVGTIKKEFDSKKHELDSIKKVEHEDIIALNNYIKAKDRLDSMLTGLNLVAKLKKLSDTPVEITSIATGAKLSADDGNLPINEAVEIKIPGIMELQLMPQGVDVDDVKKQLFALVENIKSIYDKYGVNCLEALQQLSARYNEMEQQVNMLQINLVSVLGDNTWENLSREYDSLPNDVESLEQVTKDIKEICGSKDIQEMIAYYKSVIATYEKKHSSLEELQKSIILEEDELSKCQSNLAALDDIPEEYSVITDVDAYKNQLRDAYDTWDKECETIASQLKSAEISLGDRTSEEFEDKLASAQEMLDNSKATYQHWKNIYDKFVALRTAAMSTQNISIEPQFKKYLDIISSGKLTVTNMDDKLNVDIASGNNAMTYNTLSAGTKDTVALAFRLAMLEYIFPEGGGIAFFDDPISEMDPNRRVQACKLIEEFAKNNQVIFVTCDEMYTKLLSGNVINI